jgi:predicted transcriptional regulator
VVYFAIRKYDRLYSRGLRAIHRSKFMAEIEQADLTTLTVDLLSAYLSNNTVDSPDLAGLIQSTHTALSGINAPAPEEPAAPEFQPAVTVRKSLGSRDHILSLIDGKPYKTLKRHLSSHGLTPAEYRTRYKLPADYPIVAPSYSEHRRAVAERLGLGRKPAKAPLPQAAKPDAAVTSVAAAANTTAPAKTTARSAAPKADASKPKAAPVKAAPVKAAKPVTKRVAKSAPAVTGITEAAPAADPVPTTAAPSSAKASSKAPAPAKAKTPKATAAKAPASVAAVSPKVKADAAPKPAKAKTATVAKAAPAAKPAKASKAK